MLLDATTSPRIYECIYIPEAVGHLGLRKKHSTCNSLRLVGNVYDNALESTVEVDVQLCHQNSCIGMEILLE